MTSEEIAIAKRCAPTMEGFERFQALEQLYRGASAKEVALLSDRSLQTIRHWIKAFNGAGIDGIAMLSNLSNDPALLYAPLSIHQIRSLLSLQYNTCSTNFLFYTHPKPRAARRLANYKKS